MTVQIITLSVEELYSIGSLTTVAQKANGDSPVLQTVRVESDGTTVTAVATDRYRGARVTFPARGDSADVVAPVVIARGALERFVKAVKAAKRHKDDTVTIHVYPAEEYQEPVIAFAEPSSGLVMTEQAVKGNYPPVERLFPASDDEFKPFDTFHLNPAHVADAAKILHPAVDPKHDVVMRMRAKEHHDKGIPGVVLFDRVLPEGVGTVEFIMQSKKGV